MRRLLLVLLPLLSTLPALAGTPITVNNAGWDGDANPGDGVCDTGSGACTLLAAIEEINASTDPNDSFVIQFGAAVSEIVATSTVPQITRTVQILGATGAGERVILNGNGQAGGLRLSANAQGSLIDSLVIHSFDDRGIELVGRGNAVQNCYIGVSADGQSALPNNGTGIEVIAEATQPFPVFPAGLIDTVIDLLDEDDADLVIAALSVLLGGIEPNLIVGNLIAGNQGHGIEILNERTLLTVVTGNRIGVNASASAVLGNGGNGIRLGSSTHLNWIGPHNLISGNDGHGILVDTGSVRFPNLIARNAIGPGADPTSNIGNVGSGVRTDTWPHNDNPTPWSLLLGPQNAIAYNHRGASTAPPDGVAGQNSEQAGVVVTGSSDGIWMLGNFIGLPGLAPVIDSGNIGDGINISAGSHVVGGDGPGLANFILNNTRHGITLRAMASAVEIAGNFIGLDEGGSLVGLGNGFDGIRSFAVNGARIGGSTGERNLIAGNQRHGIKLTSGNTRKVLMSQNSIVGNAGLGIDLDRPEDLPDSTGHTLSNVYANRSLQRPIISAVGPGGQIDWTLQSAANDPFLIEAYASDADQVGSFAQGADYLGSFTTMTDGSGFASGSANFPAAQGRVVTLKTVYEEDPGEFESSEFSDGMLLATAMPGSITDGASELSFLGEGTSMPFAGGFAIALETPAGVTEHARELGWWYRLDGMSAQARQPLPDSASYLGDSAQFTWNDVDGQELQATLTVRIEEVSPGGGAAQTIWDLSLSNLGAQPRDLDLFVVADLRAGGNDNNANVVESPNWLRASDGSDEVDLRGPADQSTQPAQAYQVAAVPVLRDLLNGPASIDLDNSGTPFGPGDVSAALQWSTVALAGRGSINLRWVVSVNADAVPVGLQSFTVE